MNLTLYSTQACRLCEVALEMLRSMPELQRAELDVVDIAMDDALLERYGALIPVLSSAGKEISWPFNADDVLGLLYP